MTPTTTSEVEDHISPCSLYALNRRTTSGAAAPTVPYQNLCQLQLTFTILAEQNSYVLTDLCWKQLGNPRKNEEQCQHCPEERTPSVPWVIRKPWLLHGHMIGLSSSKRRCGGHGRVHRR